jgi:hypothetical protein
MTRLEPVLRLTEFAWESIETFVPVYDLICDMMALHGFVFAKTSENGG